MPTPPDKMPDAGIAIATNDSLDGQYSTGADRTKEQEEQADRLKQIRKRFQIHQTFWSPIFAEALEDDKFIAGEHWPEAIKNERVEDGRPVLTYNLMPSFCRQITNKVREARPQIKVVPVDTERGTTPKIPNVSGTNDYSLADVYSGLIKHVEHLSRADQAYDTALKHSVDHSFGWFYLMNEWSKIDPFVQDLVIHRVKNSYTVTMDPEAQEADYRDAQDAFMFTNIKRSTFRRKYPESRETEFAYALAGNTYDGWFDPDNIQVAQYLWIDWRDDEVLQLNNGKVVYMSVVKDILDELEEKEGIHIAKYGNGDEMRKSLKRPVCMWQKMTANEILEGPLELPFSAIPIFPVFGEEVIVDGRVRYESAIRHAKDPQRSYNYWRTAAAETVALAPRAPWVATERQVAGYEEMYEQANTKNIPVVLYNHQDGQNPPPPPKREYPAAIAAAELQNSTADAGDIQTIIGLHEASLGAESNEKSGRAIKARQSQGFTATFQFPDNLNRAQEQCGRLMVEAFPKIMDTQRVLRIRLPDNTDDFVEINTSVRDEDTGKTILMHDIAYGKYDVVIDTGPTYQTQREEAAELQMQLLKILGPEMARNIAHLIVQNLGTPGSAEVAAVLRKMLPEALKSEDEKMAELPKGVTKDEETGQLLKDGKPWQPEPTLEQQLAQKQQQIDELKNQAEIEKHKATQATAQANGKKAEAELAKAQAEMRTLEGQASGMQVGQDSGNMLTEIKQLIGETMEEHRTNPDAHKDATSDQIAEAVVDALKRVRGYVDRTVQKSAKESPGEIEEECSIPSKIEHIYDDQGKLVKSVPGEVVSISDRKPAMVEHIYDDQGKLVQSVPVFDEENRRGETR